MTTGQGEQAYRLTRALTRRIEGPAQQHTTKDCHSRCRKCRSNDLKGRNGRYEDFLEGTDANMADLGRISTFLPTIKCSSCGQQVEISMMGDHVCGTGARERMFFAAREQLTQWDRSILTFTQHHRRRLRCRTWITSSRSASRRGTRAAGCRQEWTRPRRVRPTAP